MTMTDPNAAQVEFWNTTAGHSWAQLQEDLDTQIQPLGAMAMRALSPAAGEHVLDIGCGCGQTSIELAALTGATGHVTGIDISAPMLDVARTRPLPANAVRPDFQLVDAQTADLGQWSYDAAFSRFGVMFFSDPVAAFTNIRRCIRPGGRLAFVCWRALAENPFMRVPLQAALPWLPSQQPTDPHAPGPFAFADADRVQRILTQAGFAGATADKRDLAIGGQSLDQTLRLTFRIGPLGAAVRENPTLADKLQNVVRTALAEYDTPQGVFVPGAVWIVQARNGSA